MLAVQYNRMKEEERFTQYVRYYDPSDEQIALKIRHTWKVVGLADTIGQTLDLSEEEKKQVHLAALFHDIGRFEQVRRYHTFIDAISVDHALLGEEILRKEAFLSDQDPLQAENICLAVKWHSAYAIPESLNPWQKTLCRIIRDADKIDIFRVRATDDPKATTGADESQIASETLSPSVFEAIKNGKSVRRQDRKTALDIWVSFLGFFADMNYPVSFALCEEQGYWKKPFESIPFQNESAARQIEELVSLTENRIQEQAGKNRSVPGN